MQYHKIEFTSGLKGFAYQQVNDIGEATQYFWEDGKKIDFIKDGKEIVYEARFVEENVAVPFTTKDDVAPLMEVIVEPPAEELPVTVDALEEKIRQVVSSM